VRQIRTLRAMRRELETGLRHLLPGHEGGTGHRQGAAYGFPRQFPALPARGDRPGTVVGGKQPRSAVFRLIRIGRASPLTCGERRSEGRACFAWRSV
jgi:hypothetical protein